MRKSDPEIIHRKLGRHKADGLAWIDENIIEIDSKIKGCRHLETMIHELLHMQNPKWSEIKVQGDAKQLAEILWKHNYRRIDL